MACRVVFVLALVLAQAASAQGYLRTAVKGNPNLCIFWPQRSVTYHLHSAGSARTPGTNEFTALRKSYETWQTVADGCSDFQLVEGAMVSTVTVGYDQSSATNSNIVTFREVSCFDVVPATDPCHGQPGSSPQSCDDKYECWNKGALTIALTTITYSTRSGEIRDADIELNAAQDESGAFNLFTTVNSPPCSPSAQATTCVATDIENTMTHELGHFIGLDHVDLAGSTMEPTANIGETHKRSLDMGSIQGFCTVYPAGRASPPGCDDLFAGDQQIIAVNKGTPGLSQLGCATTAGPVAGLLLAAAGAWALRRRKKVSDTFLS